MIQKITLTLAFLLMGTSINAQFKRGSKEKIHTLKIAYITEQLDLSEKEAEKFWPVYNKYDKKMMELRFEEHVILRNKIHKLGGVDALNEDNAKEITEKIIALDKLHYKTKQAFFDKISDILSYKKALKLEIAEKNFNRKLLRKYRGKHKPKN